LKALTIKEALQRASFCLQQAGIEQHVDESEILLARILNLDRLQLFLNHAREITNQSASLYQEVIERRCQGEPAAYISGEKYFYGRPFIVNEEVLIPRPETELIIDGVMDRAGKQYKANGQGIKCIDLGTGSGVIAVTLALLLPKAEVWAIDISKAALHTARLNAARYNVQEKIRWCCGNYFDPLDGLANKPQFNLVVSNPPYLTSHDLENLPDHIKRYEPVQALFGGEDGLGSYRMILERLPEFAAQPALVLMEAGAGQKEQIEKLCSKIGLFKSISWRYDLSGWPRVIEALI